MLKLADILDQISAYHPTADLDLIKKCYVFASTSHEGQMRRSGEPYITHPLAVASIITEMKLDTAAVCAALLHDVVEDTPASYQDLEVLFSKEIAELVDGVTKLGKLRFRNKAERQAESFRKMLLAMSRDIRVILVKLADRLHNMRTLGNLAPEKARGIATETRDIYAPLANRLGIQWIKTELEDLSFRYIEPEAYQSIRAKVNEKRSEREGYIQDVIGLLGGLLEEHHVTGTVSGRPKHFASIHWKMKAQNIDYEQVYDAIAFRIMVQDVTTCYQALGAIHSTFRPIPGRFKDYVALPKPNRYQSLHTVVLGPHNRRMEVQIRTHEMHEVAENGIAAHWKYKEGKPVASDDEQKFAWLRQLLEYQKELDDPTDFLDMVKLDLFNAEVYVFTPRGDLKVLPKSSTPLDFAYAIHSEVGESCAGALVNNAMVSLDHQLRSGDTCEIITKRSQRPNSDQLKTVRTARARSRIQGYIRKQERERSLEVGRELLDKMLRRYRRSYNKELKSKRLVEVANAHFKLKTADDLCVLVGYGKVTAESVVNQLVPEDELKGPGRTESKISKFVQKLVGPKTGIVIDGIEDMVVRFAKCCQPVPGDAIMGFVTRGRGVAVHTLNCPELNDGDPDRRLEVRWASDATNATPISVQVITGNAPGILASLSAAFTEYGINIVEAACKTNNDRAVNTFHVMVTNADQLNRVMKDLERIPAVKSVSRIRE